MLQCVFCPIAQNFLLVGPHFQHIFFSPTTATTYIVWAVACIKFLAIENMPAHFSTHVYYGQTAGWIRMPLGTYYGCMSRARRQCVRTMGTHLPHGKGHSSPPHFSVHVYCGQTAGWSRITLGTEVGLRLSPDDVVLDGDPLFPIHKGAQQPSTFRQTALAASPQARTLPVTRIVD